MVGVLGAFCVSIRTTPHNNSKHWLPSQYDLGTITMLLGLAGTYSQNMNEFI
jgi:hypothetical protein